jgi:fucose 4-O-acetylase-like acetyltransferase
VSTTLDRRTTVATDPTRTAPAERPTTPSAPAQRGEGAPPAARSVVPRVAIWDNARFLVMVLVVLGHLIESIRGTQAIDAIYGVIYAFHMPAFLLMSGVFASSDALTPKRLARTAQLLATWLVVEFAWVLIRAVTGDTPFPSTFLVLPKWACWFLVSLFAMRVLLPYIALLRRPLVVSLVVALAVGMIPAIGQEFSVSRTLTLLPFFLLGWTIRQRGIDRRGWFQAPSLRIRIAAALVLAAGAAAVLAVMATPHFTYELFLLRRSYSAMHYGALHGLLLRGVALAIAAAMTVALVMLVPRRVRWFTRLGENSLYVYVLHIPILTAMNAGHLNTAIANTPLSAVVALAVSFVLVVALSQPLVKRAFSWALEPMWVFRGALEKRPA